MSVLNSAKERVRHLVDDITEKVGERVTTESRIQAVTIGRPRSEVVSRLQDADVLSAVFGDIAEVRYSGPNRMSWTFADDANGPEWDCVVTVEDDSRLRFVDVNPDRDTGVVLEFRDAPQDQGTEVIARVSSPAPGALTGPLIFKALYRARALLMTGEVPTIKFNPSARESAR